MNIEGKITKIISNTRAVAPVIHHITNYVTVNDCANITLAMGASPIMADDLIEVREITSIAQSLVINIGTLNQRTIASMISAGKKANEMDIPVVLDPVGVGASEFRNQTVKKLFEEINFSVIRGNMSEIRNIAGMNAKAKGVDVSDSDITISAETGAGIARSLADKLKCVVAITGAADIVSDGAHTLCIQNGNKMLGSVTGTGCMCTSLIASCCGADSDYYIASVTGILCMGVAGEIAFEKAGQKGTGSFHAAIIDEISKIDGETISRRAKLNEA